MEQYPDSITITVATAASQDSATRIWTKGSSTDHIYDCRAEANSSGRKIAGPDGALMDYAFMVFMAKCPLVIPPDSAYILTSDRFGTIKGRIKNALNGQLNTRIWL